MSIFMRDQRIFIGNNLGLQFMNSDSTQEICKVQITNLIELFFYFQKSETEGNYEFNLFQPDLLMRNVVFDDGKYNFFFLI